jgi:hypothetical protein
MHVEPEHLGERRPVTDGHRPIAGRHWSGWSDPTIE